MCVVIIIIPTFKMRDLRFRRIKELIKNQEPSKQRSKDITPGYGNPEPARFNYQIPYQWEGEDLDLDWDSATYQLWTWKFA